MIGDIVLKPYIRILGINESGKGAPDDSVAPRE
jgi:hypothetical protein